MNDKRKFKRKKEQNNPVNPEGVARKSNTNEFNIDESTIKEQQNKK